MKVATKYRKYLPATAVMLVAYLTNLLAWWCWRGGLITGNDRIDSWLAYLSIVLCVPGWLILSKGYEDPGTRFTHILVPVLNGLIWGLLALLILKCSKVLLKYIDSSAKSR
jgi:hypothetical protein